MHPLSAGAIIRVWEVGQGLHHLYKALAILSAGLPEMTWDCLTMLTIGQRDSYLVDLYEKTFGPTLRGFAICPECTEHLELNISTNDIRLPHEPHSNKRDDSFEFTAKNVTVKFRLPNSLDLAVVAESHDMATARRLILAQCVKSVTRKGKAIKIGKLPISVINKLTEYIAQCDPKMEILLDTQCPSCGHKWQMTFDIATFLWEEISRRARRLLWEVHTIASAYKWREADILSMNAFRRRFYLEMVT